MARKKSPGITRLSNGRFRARSRRKGYPADSHVFDALEDATEWKANADAGKRHGTYVNSKEAENTTLRAALKAYLGEVVGVKKGKIRLGLRRPATGSVTLVSWAAPPFAEGAVFPLCCDT